VVDILQAATQHPEVASDFVNGFNHPPSLFPWLDDAESARAYLTRKTMVPASTVL
jgi:hypothetical protein